MKSSNIKVKHYSNDSEVLCAIEPDDKTWQVTVDKEGVPHLYVRMKLLASESDEEFPGMFCLDYLLPEGTTMKELVQDGYMTDPVPPEEEEAVYAEYLKDCEAGKLPPCPRVDMLRLAFPFPGPEPDIHEGQAPDPVGVLVRRPVEGVTHRDVPYNDGSASST